MKHFLIVVDMQKDFVDGALGTEEAVAIVPAVVRKIEGFDGEIFATLDTHFENYMETAEGKHLPVPHCIKDTPGWQFDQAVAAALDRKGFTPVESAPSAPSTCPSWCGRQPEARTSISRSSVCARISVSSATRCS